MAVRRAKKVTLLVVPLLAVGAQACGSEEQAYCVNADDEVVENHYCGDDERGGAPGYFWYYSPANRGAIRRGTRLTGGEARIASTDKAAIKSRGGFGTSVNGGVIGAKSVSG